MNSYKSQHRSCSLLPPHELHTSANRDDTRQRTHSPSHIEIRPAEDDVGFSCGGFGEHSQHGRSSSSIDIGRNPWGGFPAPGLDRRTKGLLHHSREMMGY